MCTSPFPEIAAIETYLVSLEQKYKVHFNRNGIAMDEKEGWRMIHVVVDGCDQNQIEDGETKVVSTVAFFNTNSSVAICPVTVTRSGDIFSSWALRDDAGNILYSDSEPFATPVKPRLFFGFAMNFLPTCSIDNITLVDITHASISGTIDLGLGWFSVTIGTFTATVEIELKNPISTGKEDKG